MNREKRMEEILEKLEKNCPSSEFCYSNNIELQEKLESVIKGILAVVYEKNHSECKNIADIRKELARMNKECPKIGTLSEFEFLYDDLENLSTWLLKVAKGNNGETRAYTETRHLTADGTTKILRNIELRDEYEGAEYDQIVIRPNGVFVLEVKNSSNNVIIDKSGYMKSSEGGRGYDCQRSSERRRYLLTNLLKEGLAEAGHYPNLYVDDVMVWSNPFVKCDNRKPDAVHICGIEDICRYISEYENPTRLTEEEILAIEDILVSSHKATVNKFRGTSIENTYRKIAYVVSVYEEEKSKNLSYTEQKLANKAERPVTVHKSQKNIDQGVLAKVKRIVKRYGGYAVAGMGAVATEKTLRYIGSKVIPKVFGK